MSRPATGLKRPHDIPVGIALDEYELLARDSYNQQTSRAELLRAGYFKGNWRARLMELREIQKNDPKKKFLPTKK